MTEGKTKTTTEKGERDREEKTQKPKVFQIWDKNQLGLRVELVIGFDKGLGRFNVCLRAHVKAVMANVGPRFYCVTLLVFK